MLTMYYLLLIVNYFLNLFGMRDGVYNHTSNYLFMLRTRIDISYSGYS